MPGELDGWSQIVRHALQVFPAASVGPGDVVTIAVGGHGAVELRRVDARAGVWVSVAGVVGSWRHASPLELLMSNVTFAVGGFGLQDGALIVRQTLPARGLTAAVLAETVRAIALQAERARLHLAELSAG